VNEILNLILEGRRKFKIKKYALKQPGFYNPVDIID
jgi:hypothetical protein